MPCPLCKKIYCCHTPEQRGQTVEEVVEIYRQDAGKYLPRKTRKNPFHHFPNSKKIYFVYMN